MNETEIDIEQAKRELRKEYEEKTGEQLPDHVVENYAVLNGVGPDFEDVERAIENGKRMATKDYSATQVAGLVVFIGAAVGTLAFGSGVALGSNFGTAIVALVAAGFGFTLGAMMS